MAALCSCSWGHSQGKRAAGVMAGALLSGCHRYSTCGPMQHLFTMELQADKPWISRLYTLLQLQLLLLVQAVTLGWLTSGHPGMHTTPHYETTIIRNMIPNTKVA